MPNERSVFIHTAAKNSSHKISCVRISCHKTATLFFLVFDLEDDNTFINMINMHIAFIRGPSLQTQIE